MTFIGRLKKVAIKIMNKQKNAFSVSIENQRHYLYALSEPQSDTERSYYQYKCQCYLKGKLIVFAQNIAGAFLLVIYKFHYRRNAKKKCVIEPNDAVFVHEDKPRNILPDEIKEQYNLIKYNHECIPVLEKEDREFLKKISKGRRFSFFFRFRCLNDIAEYSAIIRNHTPKAIIACMEYSFTSSILTAYCEEKGIKHINVMHGDKYFYIRDSFFRFTTCYIWDIHYNELFVRMRADEKQFLISIPESIYGKIDEGRKKEFDYTYYLADESEEQLKSIYRALSSLQKSNNKKACVRPHPRYSDISIVKQVFKEVSVEDTKFVSIEESLARTVAAISLRSTVLLQAYYKGIEIVVDNITSCDMYEKLKTLDYIILNKRHYLLSDLLKNEE